MRKKNKGRYGNIEYLKNGGVRRFVANRLIANAPLPFIFFGYRAGNISRFYNKATWDSKVWDMSDSHISFQEYAEECNRILNTKRVVTKLSIQ